MNPPDAETGPPGAPLPDWESFYASYRKPGYVPGFEITHKLGGGAFGLVFRARKQSIGKDYAIKFLKVDDSEVRRAVLQELDQVRFFAEIDHPNLVAIEDRGEVDGIPYLVMGFAGAETLRDRLPAKDEGDRRELVGLFLQACRGVSALHDRSLVHFDLKPGNVFLKGNVARVGDYGLSRLLTHSRASLSMGRGTPYYMAPELLQRRGDWRSDVYSLGVMLFEILTGDLPFRGENEWEVLKKQESEAPRIPAGLPAAQRAVLGKALHKDPAQRFQTVADLMAALGAPVSAGAAAAGEVLRPAVAAPAPRRSLAATPPPLPHERTAAASGTRVEPPPLPARAFQPRRVGARRRGGSGRFIGPIVAVVAMFLVVGLLVPTMTYRSSARAHGERVAQAFQDQASVIVRGTPAAPTAPRPPMGEQPLAEQIRSFARDAGSTVAAAARRRGRDVRLKELDWAGEVGFAVDECRGLLEDLACEAAYHPARGQKLALHGYPMFIAAVARLQECDFDELDEARAASVVGEFLVQTTGLDDLRLVCPTDARDQATARRNRAAADQWRRFAERFARTEDQWRATRAAVGR